METMTLVEQHTIKRSDHRFRAVDEAAFTAKNLYNAANYAIRQSFIGGNGYIPFAGLYHLMKGHETYTALPRKVSQLVLKQLDQNWQSYFAAVKAYTRDPSQFLGRPKPPGYKHKTKGRCMLTYNDQAFSRAWIRKGIIRPSQLRIDIHTTQDHVRQVRIVPRQGYYVVEIVYERTIDPQPVDYDTIAGIDLGIDNVITLTSNQSEITPIAMNGRVIKSINQFYNKERARLQSFLGNRTSHRIQAFTVKRNRKIKHLLHVISRNVIDHLVSHGIGTLVIGYNEGWKQAVNLGRQTNQKFVQIPFMQLVHMLTYKAQLLGLQVVLQEESYTSKCSFFDGETIMKHARYLGRRIRRGLFRTSDGLVVNADVNGSYNIIKKAFPHAFDHAGPLETHPARITLT